MLNKKTSKKSKDVSPVHSSKDLKESIIMNMESRINKIGGHYVMDSEIKHGTQATIKLPKNTYDTHSNS